MLAEPLDAHGIRQSRDLNHSKNIFNKTAI
jgi:hypothetical protein